MLTLKPSLGDLIKSSFNAIAKNKSRTILTSLGIIIGVTSVILLTSIGNGLKNYINGQFESLGSNTVFIVPGKIFNDKGGFNNSESARYTTTEFGAKDIKNIKRLFPNFNIIPVTTTTVEIKYGNTLKKGLTLGGTNQDYGRLMNTQPKEGFGNWFSKEEYDKNSNVVVLGYKISQDLFGNSLPLNRKVIINGKNFKVLGVLEKKGSSMGGPDQDSMLYTTFGAVSNMTGKDNLQEIVVKTTNKDQVEDTKKQLKKLFLEKYEEDAFTIFDSSQLLSSINSIIGILTIALTGIAAISLVVGGIGIMNIMLVSVTERTKEIGLRKAIGAYPQAILIQFLIEAIILSCLGGLIGIILGALGTWAINFAFPAQITLPSVLLAFGVSSAVGIIFGVAPARKASKLSPIEALRYE